MGISSLIQRLVNRHRAPTDNIAEVPLLGILPNLPATYCDETLVSRAAGCVHQIRKMLNTGTHTAKPGLIAVSSAERGDGKTSLVLALGLSYVASGAKTLLIDSDVESTGLTRRLKIGAGGSLHESAFSGTLSGFFQPVAFPGLIVLPADASCFAGAEAIPRLALSDLFSECRRHFDVIIVDTGRVLCDTTAGAVCAAVDRTILVVRRNQQRQVVEKAISLLQPICKELAGIVFNRASATDAEVNN